MDSCHSSVRYVSGGKDDLLKHYHVELTEKCLRTFEILNSFSLLDNYDGVLLFLEYQIYNANCQLDIPVVPFDVILVLFTLVTISEHYKEPQLRDNDPYNVCRQPLNRRAVKILRFYVNLLKEFDVEAHGRYNLELLRCQFFFALDCLIPHGHHPRNWNSKLQNPYKSYISLLTKKEHVLNNQLLHLKLSKRGEFVNMLRWTLACSLDERVTYFMSAHEIWDPIVNLLLDLLDLRQKYFVLNEITLSKKKKRTFVQRLSESPSVKFLKIIDTFHFGPLFTEYLFTGCNDDRTRNKTIKPVYNDETQLSQAFVPRFKYPKSYILEKSMKLRKRLLVACFNLLITVPRGHRLCTIHLETDDFLNNLSWELIGLKSIEYFQAFFKTYDRERELAFMPVINEKIINDITDLKFNLVDQIVSIRNFLKEWTSVIHSYLLLKLQELSKAGVVLEIYQIQTCLLALFEYFEFIHEKDGIKKSKFVCILRDIITAWDTAVEKSITKVISPQTKEGFMLSKHFIYYL
ncbi:Smc5-Smc6 complex subunit NSE5 KNAG_0B03510 [Huiozyma naganishii CBS 8797]|uniref:Uncharacterized protein n=1 Tax=Huiozyma naganishii (strain ATCC MYA-139 / BCRC 22969 / CBS 8797 / KCTC 17520 / NBRC 10181 / NCYC 3082 / Yp74L-3) TaxID=1071383 RepID=J7RGY0_HUIN7|nr:hypothetical protein KNAG_0B03510 [Kazachstania naganishii CBS 8797]CCK68793.1 hypothetical protein KNAG_0B03510 [Kazachstania naganishii CBS 8797]